MFHNRKPFLVDRKPVGIYADFLHLLQVERRAS